MMRTASARSMYITASKRRRSEMPNNTNRTSTAEWRGSDTILPEWIAEDRRRLFERYSVLGEISRSLARIPLELQCQPSLYLRTKDGAPAQIGRVFHRHSSALSSGAGCRLLVPNPIIVAIALVIRRSRHQPVVAGTEWSLIRYSGFVDDIAQPIGSSRTEGIASLSFEE